MRIPALGRAAVFLIILASPGLAASPAGYERDPRQPVDEAYGRKIREYTTDPSFNSPLTDYLPASKTVPTPAAVLGDVAGAPNFLPHVADIHRYFRLLAEKSPRVRVLSIGRSEEGREMIAVAIAEPALLADRERNDARLARLADPRTIGMNDAEAEKLVAASVPVYYITGAIHSPETGSPTALMELAYRLAVDESPYIRRIRSRVITLITPVVEVDGRDRMADLYAWHRAHPEDNWPRLVYWGHYVAHDNNRDAMTMTLALTRNVLDTYVGWHAQVLHDLHESVPFLYDNTVGDGPYNAWIDPILANEWQLLGWDNVQEMTKLGLPGVFTHGNFDTWSPGYLMFLAAMHNGISRLYETFGNGGADTVERILDPGQYERTWFRPNPPLPKVLWSQRNNNNYQQAGLLTALRYFADNDKLFLRNFYLKSRRSIEKPRNGGPSAYVLPGDEPRSGAQAALLRVLQAQHCEIQRATAPFSVAIAAPADSAASGKGSETAKAADKKEAPTRRELPAGSYIVRMDQPYSRIADALLDRQYWAPGDPQKNPYDDTGWSLGDLFGAGVVRVTEPGVLEAPMKPVDEEIRAPGGASGIGPFYLADARAESALVTFRYRLPRVEMRLADAAFDQDGRHYERGALVVRGAERGEIDRAARELGLELRAVGTEPAVASHAIAAPRIALMHTWLGTQTEGWWRMALDRLSIPYTYISTQDAAREADLRAHYDVILFGPVDNASTSAIVDGLPMWGNPLPWETTPLTPSLGVIDSTDDLRPGLGREGVAHLREFVEQGGLLVTSLESAQFAIDVGLAPGVFVAPTKSLNVVGSILQGKVVEPASPVAYGYGADLALYSADGMSFAISNLLRGDRRLPRAKDHERPTGRGGPKDEDIPQGRPYVKPPDLPDAKPWQALPLNEEQTRNNLYLIPEKLRPRALVRFGDADGLLISGLLEGGSEIAQRIAVAQASLGEGHVLLFASNPIYRGETFGTYPLVWNALLNFDHLELGRGESAAPPGTK
jgi:hypothetical protein